MDKMKQILPPKHTGKPGKPSKLTPQLQDLICEYIRQGNYIETACKLVGIHQVTYHLWLRTAGDDYEQGNLESPYLSFYYAVKKAEADSESEVASKVKQTSIDTKNPFAMMMYLERRHPSRWGRRNDQQPGGNTYNVNIDKAIVTASAKLGDVIEELAARLDRPPPEPTGEVPPLLEVEEDAIE